MKTEKAQFLITQINPILKHSTSFIRKLELDPDNGDIKLFNLCKACLHRIDYTGKTATDVAYEVFDYIRG